LRLEECTGKLVRIRWRDIVERTSSSLDVEELREEHKDWACSWTTGVLIHVDAVDIFIATTLGVTETDASEKGNSVMQIPRAVVERAYLLKCARQVTVR
jgi:hypothetical protein